MYTQVVFHRTVPTRGNVEIEDIANSVDEIKNSCSEHNLGDAITIAHEEIIALERMGFDEDLPDICSDNED